MRLSIVEAAGRLLLERGYQDFTIEGVAARAGASKGTIYKWWPSKGALALDGYSAAVRDVLAYPESGDPRADLLAQISALITNLTTTTSGRAIRELIGAAQFDPHLGEQLRERYFRPRRDLGQPALRRLLGPDAGDDRLKAVGTAIYGAVYHLLLTDPAQLDAEFAQSLVTLASGERPDSTTPGG